MKRRIRREHSRLPEAAFSKLQLLGCTILTFAMRSWRALRSLGTLWAAWDTEHRFRYLDGEESMAAALPMTPATSSAMIPPPGVSGALTIPKNLAPHGPHSRRGAFLGLQHGWLEGHPARK